MTGTFGLTLIADNGDFRRFDVSNIAWVFNDEGHAVSVSGHGEYRVGGVLTTQHQLTLDLLVDGMPQQFDSGLVAGGGNFPRIDIDVAANGFFCHDSVFVVHAAPLSATGVTPVESAVEASALPNPFRDVTRISFQMPASGAVDLKIYDVTGRVVRTLSDGRSYGAGPVSFEWDGRSDGGTAVPTGVYFARYEGAGMQGTLRIARVR